MKTFFYIAVILVLLGCDTDPAWDCLQTSGPIEQRNYRVGNFEAIDVLDRVQLFLKQGATTEVTIESGENLFSDIEVFVEDNTLVLKNNNDCNLTRGYGITKAYVTAPNILQIRNGSSERVESIGTLSYPTLFLISEDFEEEDEFYTNGDFKLHLDVESINTISNNLSNFFLSGKADRASFRVFSGDSRFEAGDLLVGDLRVFHRGTNAMIVNPVDRLSGEIRSTGNVISVNRPPIVDIERFFTGRLIFED